MLLHTLSLDERKALMGLALHLVYADGNFGKPEELRLRALRREMDLDPEEELPEDPLEALPAPFNERDARVRALLALLAMAWSDGHFHPEERAIVAAAAERFGLSRRLPELEDWARRYAVLFEEIRSL